VFQRFILVIMGVALLASGAGLFPQQAAPLADDKNATAEAITETVIFAFGTRGGLAQVRRNGIERGRMTRVTAEGRTEEATYELRFIRGESAEKDKVRLDQKSPTVEYSLIYGEGRTWGLINGSAFTPRQEATEDFIAQIRHGIDALLRYKENGSTLSLVGKDKQMGLDLWIIDLTDKEKQRTRYYVSAKTARVLWLEYEQTPANGAKPVKFVKKFYDYRIVQGTLKPYRTVLYENGKQTQETHVMTITYGVKMEDSLFQNPETQTAAQP
jgi:hypothetical protein